jgi:hypothetical protein
MVIIDDNKFMRTILDRLVSTLSDIDGYLFESPEDALGVCRP